MKNNDNREFIKIDMNNLYIDKNIISSLFYNANIFFKSFEDFAGDVNEKLDYLIGAISQNDINTNNRPTFILNSKEKHPEDTKSKSNSKNTENVSSSESNTSYEKKEKESLTSKIPVDSIKKRNKKKKNIIGKNNQNDANIPSTSINSQFFLYKNNINELIDNNDSNK